MDQDLSAVFADHHRSLLKVDSETFFDVNVALIQEAVDRGNPVIYVATKKPYLMLKKELRAAGVKLHGIRFVDCIIKTIMNEKVVEEDGVLYLSRNDDLRNISTAISTAATTSNKKSLLVIDSLGALLASHSTEKVSRFIGDVQERLETVEMNLVLFDEGRAVEDEIGKEIYETVDNVIFLRGGLF